MMVRFSDIKDYNNKLIMDIGNRKVQLKNGSNPIIDPIRIYQQFREFIMSLGYEKYKNTDRFIIGHEDSEKYYVAEKGKTAEENLIRYREKTMVSHLSKAFSHYYKQINTTNTLSLKSVRKSSLTRMKIINGKGIHEWSGHSGEEVLDKHYYDKLAIALEQENESISMF